MKTPKNFDYDLWTTEDGKCMVRVKSTGEVTEVERDVMQLLRAEEKRLRRSSPGSPSDEEDASQQSVLSLNALSNDIKSSSWLADPHDFASDLQAEMLLASFRVTLDQTEREIFDLCLLNGMSVRDYAERSGMPKSSVWDIINRLRKNFQKTF